MIINFNNFINEKLDISDIELYNTTMYDIETEITNLEYEIEELKTKKEEFKDLHKKLFLEIIDLTVKYGEKLDSDCYNLKIKGIGEFDKITIYLEKETNIEDSYIELETFKNNKPGPSASGSVYDFEVDGLEILYKYFCNLPEDLTPYLEAGKMGLM